MVVKKFGYRVVPCGALQQIGYVTVSRSGVVRDRKPSVRVISTVTAIWPFDQIAWVLYGQASRAISIG